MSDELAAIFRAIHVKAWRVTDARQEFHPRIVPDSDRRAIAALAKKGLSIVEQEASTSDE